MPLPIINFIEQHHGTTLVEYFFRRAQQNETDATRGEVEEHSYRYPGPKPQTREAGLVLPAQAHRVMFENDVWDFTEVIGLPVQMALANRRFDFTAILDTRWRLLAKELILAVHEVLLGWVAKGAME